MSGLRANALPPILRRLRDAGAVIGVDGRELTVSAPPGLLDDATQAELHAQRLELAGAVGTGRLVLHVVAEPSALIDYARGHGHRLSALTLDDGQRAVVVEGPADESFRAAVAEAAPWLLALLPERPPGEPAWRPAIADDDDADDDQTEAAVTRVTVTPLAPNCVATRRFGSPRGPLQPLQPRESSLPAPGGNPCCHHRRRGLSPPRALYPGSGPATRHTTSRGDAPRQANPSLCSNEIST